VAEVDGGSAGPGLTVAPPRSLRSSLPVVGWLPQYGWRKDFGLDLVAGIALAALLVPESMGYAGVARVPTEVGLYAAFAAAVAYAITGGTSVLVVGPASAVAALSASVVAEFRGSVDPVALTAALAITTGVILIGAGALRLGWIVNFISRPVLEAFVAGLSISIIVGQLGGLVGVEVSGSSAVAKFVDVLRSIGDWQGTTAAIGFGSVALLLLLERLVPRLPAAVVVVAGAIALVVVFHLDDHGVAIVGHIPRGLPAFGVPDISGTRWLELFGAATALLLVGFSEGYAAASAVSAKTGETVDADQELLGAGFANVAAGFAGGLPVSGSLSKSAASQGAGARTQMANLVAAAIVLATLLFLAPVFEKLPEPVLASVVIVAVLRAANPRSLVRLWRVNRLDFIAAFATFALVLVWETLPAMIVGVAVSLAFLVHRASFPDVVELSRGDDGVFRRVDGDTAPPARRVAVLRFEAPLVYANAERLRQAAGALLDEHPGAAWFVIDAEMWSDLDATGAETLTDLDDNLKDRHIEVRLARVHRRARAQMERSGLAGRFAGRLYDRLEEATELPSP
jgi:sulfate permease, SulP family